MLAVGSIAFVVAGFYVMPTVQKKLENKIYQKMK
jgi:hypothetical protein